MKPLTYSVRLIVLIAIVAHHQGMAQQNAEFATLPLDQAKVAINQAESQTTLTKMASDALASRRLELINLCFNNQYTRLHLYEALRHTTDAQLQSQVALLMLRSGSAFWPPDDYETGFQPKRPLDEPLKGIILAHLPKEALGDSAVATRASRLALADRLAPALGAVADDVTKTLNDSASSVEKPPLTNFVPSVLPPAPKKAPETKPAPAPREKPTSSTPWEIIVVLIVAATGLLWLLIKKRK